MSDAFQVLSDCPQCHVEAAVIELLDPSIAEGVAIEARCQMCGRLSRMGVLEQPGISFMVPQDAIAALQRWADAEGEADLELFAQSNFSGLTVDEIARRLVAGERVPTNFDVVAFLFPGLSGSGASAAPETAPVQFKPTPSMTGESEGPSLKRAQTRQSPRIVPRALVAVMLADGVVRPSERHFLDQFLAAAGMAPLEEEEIRPWRPGDLGWPEDPAPIVRAMVDLAYVDRQRDGTEWRVVREFARHWGFPLKKLESMGAAAEHRTASSMKRLWWSLRGLFLVKDTEK